jgi:hypothetical protein
MDDETINTTGDEGFSVEIVSEYVRANGFRLCPTGEDTVFSPHRVVALILCVVICAEIVFMLRKIQMRFS